MSRSLARAGTAPLVTVAIPVYNGANYLAEALQSVSEQSYERLEIIVCDDGSTDESVEIARSHADPRVSVYRHSERLGQAGNLGRAIGYATGTYFKFLFHDDLLDQEHVAEAVEGFESAGPRAALVTSRRRIIRSDGRPLGIVRGVSRRTRVLEGDDVIRRCIRSASNLVGEPSFVLTRREEMLRHLPFRLSYVVDLDVWSRMLVGRTCVAIGRTLGSFRLSPGSVTSQARSSQAREVRDFIRLLDHEHPGLLSSLDIMRGELRAELNQRLRNAVARLA